MSKINQLLSKYGESHQNPNNKLIHWVCVPAILFSLIGMLMLIPIPFIERDTWINWGSIALVLASIYYFNLSITLAIGFITVFSCMVFLNLKLEGWAIDHHMSCFFILISIFTIAWIGQFIGHKIEGKKPSFLEDIQFLLIGPAWLLHFIYNKIGLRY